MTRAAEVGRGTFTHIGSVDQVETRMRTLFAKLESPAVTNLSVTFSAGRVDATPGLLPDLYRGEPVVLAARLPRLEGDLTIRGSIGDQPWRVTLPLGSAAEGQGISKLWARRKIADAEVARTLRQASPADTDARVLALGLEHHLVTRLTSLVAVDKTPSRPDGAHSPAPISRSTFRPAGDFDKVAPASAGPRPRPRHTERRADASGAPGAAQRATSRLAPRPVATPTQPVRLPQTATSALRPTPS